MPTGSKFTVEVEQETDGRWVAEIQELRGVLCYGDNREDAIAKVEALTLRVVADQLEIGEKNTSANVVFSLA